MPSHAPATAVRGTEFHDLPRAVRHWASLRGASPALTFVDYGTDRRGVATTLSYAELDRRASAVAAALAVHCRPGDRVALTAPQGLDYVVGFLGCLYARTVAVPLYAPEFFRSNDRLEAVLRDAEPSCVLTTLAGAQEVTTLTRATCGHATTVLCLDDPPAADGAAADTGPAAPGDIAYLQYTSGSTRTPRGVLIGNDNLAAAARQSAEQSGLTEQDVIVSWLPYFHDMGLITGIAMPLLAGARAVHLAPMAFVQQPHRWLRLISDYGGTWTAAPNFALDLCVRRITGDHMATLRLDTLHTLCNGSEQVRSDSVLAFAEKFAACGFALSGHAPGYGLAEATLGVTSALDGATIRTFDRAELADGRVRRCPPGAPQAWQLVGCGTPLPGVQVRIADQGAEQPADRVGEIWVSGPNVSPGYWRRPEETQRSFGAALLDRDGRPTAPVWLRTGDLGFLHEGELFVTGRIKDVVVIDGRNHYPSDIEVTVRSALDGMPVATTAAFPLIDEKGERLVVAVELRRAPGAVAPVTREEAVRSVRRAVGGRHGVEPYEVVFLRPGAMPRTSSGKVRRHACAERHRLGTLDYLETEWWTS
ncbi:fatty acyl-AMP ligase [Streptomyces sp. TRM72054]|uniref:fatty acyl-AMP ligase n=1 Tax=Streptomyces sp. TRM72054 TaxID=2870562 RepID=UPI001C8BB04B|nr:fatty acyl-AMP ligase [Streptomyces sp. TRM72054]MBX9397653.1 fatty acyl-AMP ligase [Streptomyces sp. TRM72054]